MLYAFLEACKSQPFEFSVLRGSAAPALPPSFVGKTHSVQLSPRRVLAELAHCSALIIPGGTHLSDYGFKPRALAMIGRILVLVTLAKILGKSVHLLGVGIGPLKGKLATLLTKLSCIQADSISVRDAESYTTVRRMGVSAKVILAFDISAMLSSRKLTSGYGDDPPRKVLGISVTPVYSVYHRNEDLQSTMLNQIASDLNGWLTDNTDWDIRVFVFQGESGETPNHDAAVSLRLRELLGPHTRVSLVDYQPSPLDMLDKVAECTAFVGMRFHSCVFAFLSRLPLLVVPYHPKCISFAKEIRLPESAIVRLQEIPHGGLRRQLNQLTRALDNDRAALDINEAIGRAQSAIEQLIEAFPV